MGVVMMRDTKMYKRRGREQKLVKAIQNNVYVNTMFRLHKGKVSTKFLIRCIERLCKENKELFDMLVSSQQLRTEPFMLVRSDK